MKRYLTAMSVAVLLTACQQGSDATDSKSDQKTNDSKQATVIADKDKMSYAIGMSMASNVTQLNNDFKSVGINSDAVKQGFLETLAGNSAMTEEQLGQEMQIFQQKMRVAQQAKMQEMQATQAAENQAYFAKLDESGEYTKTESGLYYKVLTPAPEGAAKPAPTDMVKVHYVGTFTDGKEFDSSKEPFQFSLQGGVIDGWLEGVKLMSVGSKYQFVIPPELGYGSNQRGPIPGNSILLFDVELLEIVSKEAPEEAK
ncbi:FKBP-type peptidyl-prolyl cis-trans isomerase [Aliikangiella sp. IMCC44632]